MTAESDQERQFLMNAFEKLSNFSQSGYAPEPMNYRDQEGQLLMEDLGETEPVTDEVVFRRRIADLIAALDRHHIIHGDATRLNLIVKDNKPYLIDFQQAFYDHQNLEPKRPEGDAYWLWHAAEELSPDTSRHIRKWRALRTEVNEGSILDLGCDEGDYLLFAQVENNNRILHGVERRKVKPCSESLIGAIAYGDIMHHENFRYDNVFFFSVFGHLQDEFDWEPVDDLMRAIIMDCGTLWFETHLFGDGPGQIQFETDEDVFSYLQNFTNNISRVVTIPVHGRETTRTIWKVRK
jgi:hypothetical protein